METYFLQSQQHLISEEIQENSGCTSQNDTKTEPGPGVS